MLNRKEELLGEKKLEPTFRLGNSSKKNHFKTKKSASKYDSLKNDCSDVQTKRLDSLWWIWGEKYEI